MNNNNNNKQRDALAPEFSGGPCRILPGLSERLACAFAALGPRSMRGGGTRVRKSRPAPRKGRNGQMVISHPPPIQPQLKHRQRMRFSVGTALTLEPILFADLLDTILFAATATAGYDVYDQVRINSVEMWAAPVIGGTAQVLCQFDGQNLGAIGDGKIHSDSSMGIQPAHIVARPEKDSQCAQWQFSAGGAQAFSLTAPVGAIVDVDLSFRTVQSIAPVAAQNALVGATVGELYYRGLDGVAIATTKLTPIAPTTR
jgi:hypothetical protein